MFSRFVVTLEMEFLIYSLPPLKNTENRMPLFTVNTCIYPVPKLLGSKVVGKT